MDRERNWVFALQNIKPKLERIQVELGANCKLIGLFGSVARNAGESGDVDILIVTECPINSYSYLGDGISLVTMTPNELQESSPLFKYSLAHDLVTIYEAEDFNVRPYLHFERDRVLDEILENVVYYLNEVLRELRSNTPRPFLLAHTFEMGKYASWYFLATKNSSLSNNSPELQTTIEKHLGPYVDLLHMLTKSSLLEKTRTLFGAYTSDLADAEVSHLMNTVYSTFDYVWVVILLSKNITDLRDSFSYVERRIEDFFTTKDRFALRGICQDLFLIIYDLIGLYLLSRGKMPPETHVRRRELLTELGESDSYALTLLSSYDTAFEELHVICHYRMLGDERILQKWQVEIEKMLINFDRKF